MALDRRSVITGALGVAAGGLASHFTGRHRRAAAECTTPTGPRTTDPVADPTATATATTGTGRWASGASLGFGTDPAAFSTLRGEPVTYIRIWADVSLAEMQNIGMMDAYRSFTGTLEIGCGGPQGGQTWASAATGGMDATWKAQMATINAKWGSIAAVQLSMAHELNGNWYPWSVKSGQQANVIAAWRRFHGIVQSDLVAKGRNAKVTINFNAEDVGAPARESYWPGDAFVDIVGVDVYDGLGNHEPQIPGWLAFAKSHGKAVSFPEWGLNPEQISDNPDFITRMHDLFVANVATLAGEAYFNEKASTLGSAVPKSRDRYASLVWG